MAVERPVSITRKGPTAYDIAASVVLNDGNMHVVAEQYGMSAEDVLNLLTSDPAVHDLMSRQFRTKALVKQFAIMGDLSDQLSSSIVNMRADHLVNAFKALSASFATLSASGQVAGPGSSSTTNIFERAMAYVSPQVREALMLLKDTDPDDPEILAILGTSANDEQPSEDNDRSMVDVSGSSSAPYSDAPRPILPVQAASHDLPRTKSQRAKALALLDS